MLLGLSVCGYVWKSAKLWSMKAKLLKRFIFLLVAHQIRHKTKALVISWWIGLTVLRGRMKLCNLASLKCKSILKCQTLYLLPFRSLCCCARRILHMEMSKLLRFTPMTFKKQTFYKMLILQHLVCSASSISAVISDSVWQSSA